MSIISNMIKCKTAKFSSYFSNKIPCNFINASLCFLFFFFQIIRQYTVPDRIYDNKLTFCIVECHNKNHTHEQICLCLLQSYSKFKKQNLRIATKNVIFLLFCFCTADITPLIFIVSYAGCNNWLVVNLFISS